MINSSKAAFNSSSDYKGKLVFHTPQKESVPAYTNDESTEMDGSLLDVHSKTNNTKPDLPQPIEAKEGELK